MTFHSLPRAEDEAEPTVAFFLRAIVASLPADSDLMQGRLSNVKSSEGWKDMRLRPMNFEDPLFRGQNHFTRDTVS